MRVSVRATQYVARCASARYTRYAAQLFVWQMSVRCLSCAAARRYRALFAGNRARLPVIRAHTAVMLRYAHYASANRVHTTRWRSTRRLAAVLSPRLPRLFVMPPVVTRQHIGEHSALCPAARCSTT